MKQTGSPALLLLPVLFGTKQPETSTAPRKVLWTYLCNKYRFRCGRVSTSVNVTWFHPYPLKTHQQTLQLIKPFFQHSPCSLCCLKFPTVSCPVLCPDVIADMSELTATHQLAHGLLSSDKP